VIERTGRRWHVRTTHDETLKIGDENAETRLKLTDEVVLYAGKLSIRKGSGNENAVVAIDDSGTKSEAE
jgi:hypothetical protein